MGRFQLTLASMVAAVPAGILGFVLVYYGLMSHFEAMGTMLKVLSGLTLLVCALLLAMPVGVLIFAPGSAPAAPAAEDDLLGEDDDFGGEDLGDEAVLDDEAEGFGDDDLADDLVEDDLGDDWGDDDLGEDALSDDDLGDDDWADDDDDWLEDDKV